MSGIINSAGSRSGVIGTTEIDYEEGDFTPTSSGSTSSTWGRYVKVGNVVHVWCRWAFNATTASATLTGLPFTSSTIQNNIGILATHSVNWTAGSTSCAGYVGAGSTTFTPLMSGDNVGWATGFDVISGAQAILQLTYNTA